jgi:CubicO group peptidase (beta-lactamase class C family)
VVAIDGRILFAYGDTAYNSNVASVRKSVLGMMYGKYVVNGTIDLNKTVKQLGLDDVQKFLPNEERARLEHLLMARSGVYHPNEKPAPTPADDPPARGSQFPGTFYAYQNWDFNAAGTAFQKLTRKDIYQALQTDLATPLGMQDYSVEQRKKVDNMPYSVHKLYPMRLSTRDMARLGLLMLRKGKWNGVQLIDERWVDYMTQLATPAHEIFPTSLRNTQTTGPWRWGYGKMWWVWDQPKLPPGLGIGPFYGAYMAWGVGGQLIVVLPDREMVIAHKVEIEGEGAGDMSPLELATAVQMAIASRR